MADYPANEYSDEEEWNDNFIEEQREAWEKTQGDFPMGTKPENVVSLFKDVWKTHDSTKVANIDPKTELGDLGLSVRHCQKISYVANILHEEDVADYFDSLSEITLASSMAKKGWFTELFISTKKTAQKGSLDNFHGADKEQASKWRLFGGKKKETATVEQ